MTDDKTPIVAAIHMSQMHVVDRQRTDLELDALQEASENQQERYAAGMLPEDELLTIVRAELFKTLADTGVPRWNLSRERPAMAAKLRHEGCTSAPMLHYETTTADELYAGEWDTLRRVRTAATTISGHPWLRRGGVVVEPLTHWVTCPVCGAEVCRSFAKVTISWATRTLVREYAL